MKILVSACLLGSPCKYSGGDNLCLPLLELARNHTLIPLCPEQLGGLPTPRPPAERRNGRIVTQSGGDVTHAYEKGAGEIARLARLLDVKAAILKSRSPACGWQKVVQLLRVAVAVFLDELGQRIHAGGRIAQVVDHVVPQCLLLANLMLHILAECVHLLLQGAQAHGLQLGGS